MNYVHEMESERLYRLCYALVERKLADEQLWNESDGVGIIFAQNAIQHLIKRVCGKGFKDQLGYLFEIRDDLGTGRSRRTLRRRVQSTDRHLAAMFHVQQLGFLSIGAAIDALEEQQQYLGASFYHLLCASLYRRMRLYTHHDAGYYKEHMEELREEADPEERDQYEIPPVDEAIPEPVQALENMEEWTVPRMRALLRRHLNGPHGKWIRKLLMLHRLSQLRGEFVRFEEEFDSYPMPSALVVFRQHDAIEACFDQEENSYYESSCEPTCAVSFRPENKTEFDAALRAMTIFLKVNRNFAELITLLNSWGERAEHRDRLPTGSPSPTV